MVDKTFLPVLIALHGLKNSGKTTVAEGLIASLCARGYTVGSIKISRQPRFNLDWRGSDTWRHTRAGAAAVLAQSREETLYLEIRAAGRLDSEGHPASEILPEPKTSPDLKTLLQAKTLLGHFPEGLQFVVAEGLSHPEVQVVVVCLSSREDLEEVIALRGTDRRKIAAVSGRLTDTLSEDSGPGESGSGLLDYPVYDVIIPEQREALVSLLLERTGNPAASAAPHGPLYRDAGWLPG
jgi:molybdopterin-guanine dinucleotide biosynthesis protein